jgi:hypothetical protein
MIGTQKSIKPVLVTGSHRSGSTWLANMFALAEETLLVHEPFNIAHRAYALNGLAKYWFTYAPALPQDASLEAFTRVLRCNTRKVFARRQILHWVPFLRRGRLIIKDPIACLSSEWLSETFNVEVVVLVRHPAAFAASLKRMHWTFPFDHFLEQDLLMADHLEPYRHEIEARPEGLVQQASVLWKCLYSVLLTYAERNPRWIVRTHEQLSREPMSEVQELYHILGLKWTDAVMNQIKLYTKSGNPIAAPQGVAHQMKRDSAANTGLWRKVLTEKEIEIVRAVTHELSARYYSEEEW